MNYKTHLAGGALAGVVFSGLVVKDLGLMETIINTGVITGMSLVGSLLPDIDKENTYISNRAKPVAKLASLTGHRGMFHAPILWTLLLWVMLEFASGNIAKTACIIIYVGYMISILGNRRGVKNLYIILPSVLLGVILFLYDSTQLNLVWLGLYIGVISHLVFDTLNKKGIPWLYPISKKKYHIAKIVTGGDFEIFFKYFMVALTFVVGYVMFI